MTGASTKTKYNNYTNTREQKDTINTGFCSNKYQSKTISTKSKNQLKTRDTTKLKNRKKNYRKFQNDITESLDKSIEYNDIAIDQNKRDLLYLNDIISDKLDILEQEEDWVLC